MASDIHVTDGMVRATAVATQLLTEAIDVSSFDQLDLVLWVGASENSASTMNVSIITGVTKESEDGWVTLDSYRHYTGMPVAMSVFQNNFGNAIAGISNWGIPRADLFPSERTVGRGTGGRAFP